METKRLILFFIGFVFVFAIAMAAFYKVTVKPTRQFHEDCDKLIKSIKTTNNESGHLKELIRLKDFSWHRTTGERIREIARMLEVKYNLDIIDD